MTTCCESVAEALSISKGAQVKGGQVKGGKVRKGGKVGKRAKSLLATAKGGGVRTTMACEASAGALSISKQKSLSPLAPVAVAFVLVFRRDEGTLEARVRSTFTCTCPFLIGKVI